MPNSVRTPTAPTDVCSYMAFYSLGESLTPAPSPPLLSLLPPEASSSGSAAASSGTNSLSSSRLLAAHVDPLSVSRFQTPDAIEAPLEQVKNRVEKREILNDDNELPISLHLYISPTKS